MQTGIWKLTGRDISQASDVALLQQLVLHASEDDVPGLQKTEFKNEWLDGEETSRSELSCTGVSNVWD